LQDVIRYEQQVIFPYAPRQVVVYCGENDIANDSTVTGKIVFKRFKTLFKDVRKQFPDIPFAYISMKPSPSRTHLAAKMKDGNARIKQYLSTKKNTNYIDVYDAMLENGRPISRIFKSDSLHMNAQGYRIWQKIIAPVLQ
jgi:lysophospholipase L1-like esterase